MASAKHASNCGAMNHPLPEISRETTLIGLCYWPCDLRLILFLTVTLVFRRLEFSLRHRQMSRRLLCAVLAKGRRLVLLVFQKSHNFIFQNGCEGNCLLWCTADWLARYVPKFPEKPLTFFIRVYLYTLIIKHQFHLKRQYISTRLHGVTFKNTVFISKLILSQYRSVERNP